MNKEKENTGLEIVVISLQQTQSEKKLGYSDALEIVGSEIIKPIFKTVEITLQQEEEITKKTGSIITCIDNNLSEEFNKIGNAKEMVIEFELSFNEKLVIRIFEVGSNQSIRVTLKFTKIANQ